MSRTTLLIAALLLMAGTSMGQKNQVVTKGSNFIGIGMGPGRAYHPSNGLTPAFRVHYEHGTFNAGPGIITLGGTFGYSFFHDTYKIGGETYGGTWSCLSTGARVAWHCSWGKEKLDTYGGIASGIRIDGYKKEHNWESEPDFHAVNPYFGGFVGAAYYFHPKVAVFGEFGYDISHATIGVDFLF